MMKKPQASELVDRPIRKRPIRSRSFITICIVLLSIEAFASNVWTQPLSKKTLSLSAAKKIATAAETTAARNNWAVVIAVLDDGGHLIYLERMDGAQSSYIKEAKGKAHLAALFRRPTKDFEDAVKSSHFDLSKLEELPTIRGGLPIMLNDKAIGAIGVSGGTAEQDERCAEAGLSALHD